MSQKENPQPASTGAGEVSQNHKVNLENQAMRLSDILASGTGKDIRDAWETTTAAGEFEPLPPGEYVARIVGGELKQSRSKSTPGYTLTFEVIEPTEFKGRKFWLDCWLTPAALPQTKRDLGKLGVANPAQLERPLPRFFICNCKLARRRDDDGNESNRVKSFEVLRFEPPEADPFAPQSQDGPNDEPSPIATSAKLGIGNAND